MSGKTNVLDVAKYVLRHTGEISAMKLQKLVYYCQAWSLVWDGKSLFSDPIEAWANGPVVPRLYQAHRGRFAVNIFSFTGNSRKLTGIQRETIEAIVNFYGKKSPQWLSDLTHREKPWLDARAGLPVGERGNNRISDLAMAEYYESL